MRKLAVLGTVALTLTSVAPLTANAAATGFYSQCNTGRNVITLNGTCNFSDLEQKLQELGINGNCLNWVKTINGVNSGKIEWNGCTGWKVDGDISTNNNSASNVKPQENTGSGQDTADTSYIQQVVNLVNAERAKEGLAALSIDSKVEKAAAVRAGEIQSNFDHTRPGGSSFATAITEQGATYQGAGENIAWGQKTPREVVDAWMNSPGHRANIMNENFTHIGVGNLQNSAGTQYWVQLFTY